MRAVNVPVIGIGGITNATDALEFLPVGAKGILVGTTNFIDPTVTLDIIDGIARFLTVEGLTSIEDYIGTLDTRCAFPFAEVACEGLELA